MSRDIIYTVSDKIDSNPVLWLSADKNITLNGNNVSAWGDRSGNGYNATQSTPANQPLYVPNALNGNPGILFDGVNDFLSLSNTLSLNTQTYFCVVNYNHVGGTQNVHLIGGTLYDGYQINIGGSLFVNNSSFGGIGDYSNTNILFSSVRKVDGIYTIFVDGVQKATQYSTPMELNVIAKRGSNDIFSSCYMYEIIIYNSALSDSQRQSVENYLKQKYNL